MAKTLDMHTQQAEILARIVRAEEKVHARLIRVSGLLAKAVDLTMKRWQHIGILKALVT